MTSKHLSYGRFRTSVGFRYRSEGGLAIICDGGGQANADPMLETMLWFGPIAAKHFGGTRSYIEALARV